MLHPLGVYGDGLVAGARGGGLVVRFGDGSVAPLCLERWLGPADATDEALLAGVRGPVLDVGCGPGRLLHALAARGVFGLGVDLSPVAVGLARRAGAQAIVASIFDELPGAGTWRTALLLDGNIGIGGSPGRLLERVRTLLGADGTVLVELDAPSVPTGTVRARLERGGGEASGWFAWARVSAEGVEDVAGAAGFAVARRWRDGDRWFARLVIRPGGHARSGCTYLMH